MNSNHYDIAIIGSGLSGLLTAAILSKEGKKVCVLEKNKTTGGLLQSFNRKGRIFDTGVHYFGGFDEGCSLRRYWHYLGIDQLDCFGRMSEEAFEMISIGDKEYPLASGKKNFIERLLPFFPDSKAFLSGYLQKLDEITGRISLYNLKVPEKEFSLEKSMNAWRFFQHFEDPSALLPKVLSGNNFLYGGDQDETPLYPAALINHSFISGAWRIQGGSSRLKDHLEQKITNTGGEIFADHEVKEISGSEGAFLVKSANGREFRANKIVSSLHPSVTLNLLKDIPVRKVFSYRIHSLGNTTSVFSLFICMKPGSFLHFPYNIHHSKGNENWPDGKKGIPDHFMLYTIPSSDKKYADGVIVLARADFHEYIRWENTVSGHRDEDYQNFKQGKADQLLDLVEEKFPGFRQQTEDILISTPLTWRDHNGSPEGSMYGIKRKCSEPEKSWIAAKTHVQGLYFTGQNTNMHGVLGVTIGAVQTSGEILGLPYLLNKIRNV